MKKYFIASVVAVMAFAFAAFAASLTVTANVLQAGDTHAGALECADEARVYVWGYNDHVTPPTVQELGIALLVEGEDEEHTCAGQTLTVTLLDEAGNILKYNPGGMEVRAYHEAVPGEDQGRIEMPDVPGGGKPAVEDIYGVRIGIEQGPGIGNWADVD